MLPATLMALLSASSVFSMLNSSPPKTPFDPFRAISLQVPKEPEQPICCLKPLTPLEPVQEEVLLSFEEWKAKQSSQGKDRPQASGGGGKSSGSEHAPEASPPDPSVSPAAGSSVQEAGDANSVSSNDMLPPHFRVPIVDRFNYASMDCSARVHIAHRSAKSPYNILSSKKDRYMLSPCAKPDGEKQFVVVELCDDIRIDTVQLANFEFFSGVFKDFTVSVTKVYTDDVSEWTYAGTYRAKNVRGVQSFHPPTSLRDFYRYIRIDFHSHYGNEYYCPISLLRVYGLTHLEEFKWDIWAHEAEAEGKAKRSAMEEAVAASTQSQQVPPPADRPKEETPTVVTVSTAQVESMSKTVAQESPPVHSAETTDLVAATSSNESNSSARIAADSSEGLSIPIKHESTNSTKETQPSAGSHSTDTAGPKDTSAHSTSTATKQEDSHKAQNTVTTHDSRSQQATLATQSDTMSTSTVSPSASHGNSSAASQDARTAHLDSHTSTSPPSSSTSIPTVIPSPSSATIVSLSHQSTGGESIYRTIMNRLSALEGNTTLYARYVEEHTAAIREVLRRLGEDVGRLEGLSKAQAQMYQRSIHEFDRYRRKLEIEHGELLSRVNYLADEVVLEKRLGIAQLCLLLVVLVFMGLTRGFQVEQGTLNSIPRSSSVRDWGRRTLSLSGDWVNRFKTKDPTPSSNPTKRHPNDKVQFSSRPTRSDENIRPSRKYEDARARKPRTPTSFRTPASRHSGSYRRPLTPTGNRPPIQRSNSHGASHEFPVIGPVPRSAKRWARTAHLHEVKTPGKGKEVDQGQDTPMQPDGERETSLADRSGLSEDAFRRSSSSRSNHDRLGAEEVKTRGSRMSSPLRMSMTSGSPPGHDPMQGSETDGDAWIDTDADVDASEHDADIFV
ncbi:hypothetical protein NEOLEDRAFT_1128893 [Neolentinus lepideus HHB14362 ss-1]|uniref:SUN domain-containing protein n=1 Tax=Neolentinus lepideus HHB14362 ss-1 TaxID=1314782 RepID=A0A165UUE5_9AGAM|nr:hypothetical protein NEOLEDRAFT_1128893 [Neolentinus lepideus HHB14362 ss-1]